MSNFDEKYVEKSGDNLIPQQESVLDGLPAELIKTITPAKMQMINLYLTGSYTLNNIAVQIGVHYNTLRKWMMEDSVQYIIREMQDRMLMLSQANMNNLREEAILKMQDLLNSNMDNVAFQAAKDILDRTGLKKEQKINVNKTVTTLEQQMKDLAEFTITDDDIIDIDISDVLEEVVELGETD